MSTAASWLILAVLLLRIFFKKAPKRAICVLWWIVALRLICPFSLRMPFSLIPGAEVLDMDVVQYARNPTVNTGISFLNQALNPIISKTFDPSPGASVNPMYIWLFLCGIIWVVGCVFLTGFGLTGYLRLRRTVQEAIPISYSLWICDAVKSPFILGFFKPKIYLPSDIGEEQMKYVVAHEQVHLKRKDHWWKLLGYFLLAVYWFNPLVWAAYWFFCRDLELACDENVICNFEMKEKKAYANALVSCSMQRKMVMVCPLAFGEVNVKERVKMILKYQPPAFSMTVVSVVVCVVIAACFLTDPPVSTFSGNRTGNDREFLLEFDVLNTADSQELTAETGEIISAVIVIDDGRLGVTVQKDNGELVYENIDMIRSEKIEIEIEESGRYTVKVVGKNARGSVGFRVES